MKIKLATQEQLENVKSKTFENMLKKQDKLTAGDNIYITDDTISAVDTVYDDTLLLQEIRDVVSSLRTSIDKAVYADGGKLYRDRLEFREGNPWAVRDEVGVQVKDSGYTYTPPIKGGVKLSFKAQGDSAVRENIFIWADNGTGRDKYIAKVSDSTGLYTCVLDVVNDIKISTLGSPGVTFKFWDFEVEEIVQIKDGRYTYTPPIKGKVKLSFKAQGDSDEEENIFIWTDDGTGEDKYITKVSDSTGLYTCVLDVVTDIKISTLGAPGVTFKFWDFEIEEEE